MIVHMYIGASLCVYMIIVCTCILFCVYVRACVKQTIYAREPDVNTKYTALAKAKNQNELIPMCER